MMQMRTELLKIIEGGLERNHEKVRSYAKLMSEKLLEQGETKFAERILSVLERKSVHPVYLDEFTTKPVDNDSRLDMVDVWIPTNSKNADVIFSNLVMEKVGDYVRSLNNRSRFVELGINLPESLLLYGPPGCGKTSLARHISVQTGLPLVTAKLDGLVSSLLGNTAKNIRRIFDYANQRPCILFLDEFDAIAKARDDEHEVGELKRVVNSLLQNIDDFNEQNILIAATNHAKLLDPAVWRRFSNVIEVPRPSESEIVALVKMYLQTVKYDFYGNTKKFQVIAGSLKGLSPSDIKTICFNAVKKSILSEEPEMSFAMFIYQVYLFKGSSEQEISVVDFLHSNLVSQRDIVRILGVSYRQVRKLVNLVQED